MPCLCGCCGGAVDSVILVQLYRSGFNKVFLRPCFSQSNKRLLIYGREMAKLVVASKTAFLLFSIVLFSRNVKINSIFKERVLALY